MGFKIPEGVTAIKTVVPKQESSEEGVRITWGEGGYSGDSKGEKK